MKKILTALTLIMCLLALLLLSSCNFILDLIFGPSPTPDNGNDAHVHSMEVKTLSSVCSGIESIDYWHCAECDKNFLDSEGKEEIVEFDDNGHVYILAKDEEGHQIVCSNCDEPKEDKQAHSSDKWLSNRNEHYKLCKECGFAFGNEPHELNGKRCSVCNYSEDYKTICNSRYGYEFLGTLPNGDKLQAVYNKIDQEVLAAHGNANYMFTIVLQNHKSQRMLKQVSYEGLSVEQAMNVVSTYRNDNPLFYWLGNSVSYDSKTSEVALWINNEYADGDKRINANDAVYAAIGNYIDSVSNEADDYSVALALHDELIANADYAYNEDGSAVSELWAHSIEGVLLENSAVCEGYAKTFQLLLNARGINNVYVTGSSRNVGHAWNMVQLDGGWYWYDVTWDDQPTSPRGITYDYLCKTDKDFLEDHTVGAGRTGLDYLYGLPTISSKEYSNANVLKVGDQFKYDDFSFTLCGRGAVSLTSCNKSGSVVVPSAAVKGNRTYTVAEIGINAFQTGILKPPITAVTIPASVVVIYNKSFVNSSINQVTFEAKDGWKRYPQNGTKPVYETVLESELENGSTAAKLLKNTYGINRYIYVWLRLV